MAKKQGPKTRINVIAPGVTKTEGKHEGIIGGDIEKQMLAITSLGCIGQPNDIGKVLSKCHQSILTDEPSFIHR